MTSFPLLSLARATAADAHPTLMQPPGIARRAADMTIVRCAPEVLPIREDDGIHPVAADDTAPAFHVSMPAIDPLRSHETAAPTADRVSRRYLWLFGCHVPRGDHGRPFSLARTECAAPNFRHFGAEHGACLVGPLNDHTQVVGRPEDLSCRLIGKECAGGLVGFFRSDRPPRAVAKCPSPSTDVSSVPAFISIRK